MKKNLFILVSVIICLIVGIGCKNKNDEQLIKTMNTIVYSTGTIQVINNTSDPYKIVINGISSDNFTLDSNSYAERRVKVGNYSVKATQKSGYFFYPTEYTWDIKVEGNSKSVCSF